MNNINVLSLFDGISCGQIALRRAGININQYFASEIDTSAIKVTQHNYPHTTQLGDVTKIDKKSVPQIDLLIGGSPCQGFSFAGKKLNFNDPRSKLFFEYKRLLGVLSPKFFLLENVKMKKEYIDTISRLLEVEPIEINSALLSKQNRKRLYWTNIKVDEIKPIEDNFNEYLFRLGHGYITDEIKFYKKYPTLVAQSPATKYRIITDINLAQKASSYELRHDNNITRSATPEECEDFQTLPIGYTSCLNKTNRYKVIGNGWTVNVISHIFKNLS